MLGAPNRAILARAKSDSERYALHVMYATRLQTMSVQVSWPDYCEYRLLVY